MLTYPSSATSARNPLAKSTMSGHMGEDIVGDHQVGRAVLTGDLAADLLAEEQHFGGNPPVHRNLGDIACRLDTEGADSPLDDVLEQVTVVTGHLDDERVTRQARAG